MTTTLTVTVDEQRMKELQEAAERLGVGVEELVRRSVEEFCERQRAFRRAADHVLEKNAELYRRLAR